MIENTNKILMLAFKSDKEIIPQKMYKYEVKYNAPNIDSNKAANLNSITYNLKKYEKENFITNDGDCIFSIKELSENEKICKIDDREVNVKFNLVNYIEISFYQKKIYEDYIAHLCKKNILANNKNFEKLDYDIAIKLNKNIPNILCYRVFKLDAKLLKTGHFLLYIKLFTKFISNKTVLDMKLNGEKILGRNVRYTGFYLSKPFSGTLVNEEDKNTLPEFKTVEGLENYYKNRYPNYNFYHQNGDFVAHLLTTDNKNINFLASMLSPIWTFEEIKNNLGDRYSKLAREIVVINPDERFKEALIIPQSIKILGELGDVSFEKTEKGNFRFIEPKDDFYKIVQFEEPELLVGNEKIIKANFREKRNILNRDTGYFFTPTFEENIRIALVATNPNTKKEHMEKLADNIFKLGLYNIYPKEKIEFIFTPILHHDYEIFASKLKSVFHPHIALVTLSDSHFNTEYDGDTYEEFYPKLKEAFANNQIPSQMISAEQTGKIYKNDENSKWISCNVNFGVLGKLGCIPYSLKNNVKDIDIYVGLDVGKGESGIHYPALGSAFLGDGKFIGGFCNTMATKGEKIPQKELETMLQRVIGLFFEKNMRMPKNMVIHRDGFSREDHKFYEHFFYVRNIRYALVEVVKSGAPRFMLGDSDDVTNGKNVDEGTALFKDFDCVLVTTNPRFGTSSPIKIGIVGGTLELTIEEATEQIYNLSKINAASNHNTRLPITTKYADIISKHPNFIPHGELTSALYWI